MGNVNRGEVVSIDRASEMVEPRSHADRDVSSGGTQTLVELCSQVGTISRPPEVELYFHGEGGLDPSHRRDESGLSTGLKDEAGRTIG